MRTTKYFFNGRSRLTNRRMLSMVFAFPKLLFQFDSEITNYLLYLLPIVSLTFHYPAPGFLIRLKLSFLNFTTSISISYNPNKFFE